ncbi:MAG: penicillin-binding protein, partial [Clostridiales bacterium]|nr:penicillin-binding protein [Clostridiales bacterium]
MQKIKAFFSRVRKYIKGVLKKGGVPAGAQGGVGANRPGRCMPGDGTGDTRLFGTEELQKIKAPPPAAHENEPLFKERVRRRPFILSVLFTSLRFAIIGVLLLGLVFAGAGIGIAKAYVDTSPEIDLSLLTKSDRTSFIYDKDGQLITSIAEVEYRDWVDIEDIPERVRHAFVAVEDIRFYMHTGVDAKRLFSAVLEILGNSNSSGGSTITQQLVKNKILTNERTYKRKIQEVYLAFELEKQIEKDDILEAYLNDIHLGESNYGVKTAAMDYFGKELDALSIRECALLAGLTQNPYYYNPRLNRYKRDESRWEETMKRTDKVLLNMYEAGYIDMREYEQALKEEVSILEVSEQKQLYDMPYFVEYAIRDVVTHLIAQRGLTESDRKSVETQLRTGGYHIYTTVDSDIQHRVQETLSTWDKYPELARPDESVKTETVGSGEVMETIQPQASAVVIDYHTGELRAIVGGRDTPKIRKSFNRAYQGYMELGSAI